MDELTQTKARPLNLGALKALPETVLRPTYDRAALTPGIVHIGVGNFHRAHQAWYLHRLMQAGKAQDWAIIGAGVLPHDETQRKKLAAQDYLTTLIELDPSGSRAEVIGSMIDYVPVEEGHPHLIRTMTDPAIRIVSLTVTEGGYYLDPATKRFDAAHPDIQHDAERCETPRTAFGAILRAFELRRAAGTGPFTCQSCDNLPGNGDIMRDVMLGLARLRDKGLATWVEGHVSFPNSMVDCIVPATGPRELAAAEAFGLQDAAPVTHENFRQWVMEDAFCASRPPYEEVGAAVTSEVHAHEAMKLRLLNGTHQIIANPAEVLSIETIADTMADVDISAYFRKLALREIAPHVAEVPGMTPRAYVDLIAGRFANPAIHDTVRRVAFDGSSRHTGAVLPVIRDAIARAAPLEGLALSQALWAHMCAGQREDGSEIAANDPVWADLMDVARAARTNPQAWLDQRHFYGEIADDARFCEAFTRWLTMLQSDGVRAALTAYIGV